MRAGRLRHRLAIQTVTETQNAVGELTRAWATVTTVWGDIQPIGGTERLAGEQITAEVSHRVWLRYTTYVVPEARIVFDSRTFDVLSVINRDERNYMMELLCKEVV